MSGNHLLFPHGVLTGNEVVIDYLDDNLRRLKRYLVNVDDECLHWKPDAEAISIAVILWHMGRFMDVFFTKMALGLPPEEECWFRYSWADKTGYDPRGIGRDGWGSLNQFTLEEVDAMPKYTKEQLLDYIGDVYDTVREYFLSTSMKELAQPGIGFDAKYTKYQLISMALMDNVRHLGEIRLITSLWERANTE